MSNMRNSFQGSKPDGDGPTNRQLNVVKKGMVLICYSPGVILLRNGKTIKYGWTV